MGGVQTAWAAVERLHADKLPGSRTLSLLSVSMAQFGQSSTAAWLTFRAPTNLPVLRFAGYVPSLSLVLQTGTSVHCVHPLLSATVPWFLRGIQSRAMDWGKHVLAGLCTPVFQHAHAPACLVFLPDLPTCPATLPVAAPLIGP